MINRKRNVEMKFFVTEQEKNFIKRNMQDVGIKSFSTYARKMLIDGYVIKISDIEKLNKLIYEINKIGVNINQITKVANETKNVETKKINDLNLQLSEIKNLVRCTFGYN